MVYIYFAGQEHCLPCGQGCLSSPKWCWPWRWLKRKLPV